MLDLTHTVAGPLCGRVLADLGADVISVEPPSGDYTRSVPPVHGDRSPLFSHMNAGKRSVCVDLRTPAGARLLARLAGEVDVLVENWRPEALARHGLGAEELLGANPRLIYCSITGWGQTGPWAQRRAYAPLVHAEAGTIEMAARLRGGPPVQEVHQHADLQAGTAAAQAVLAALFQRERTGAGQHLDVSMAEALLFVNDQLATDLAGYTGERAMDTWTFAVLPTGGGELACLVGNPLRAFHHWMGLLSGESLVEDPRFATPADVEANAGAAIAELARVVATFADVAAIEAATEGAPFFVSPVRSVRDLAGSEWAAERHVFVDPGDGHLVPTLPWRGSRSTVGPAGPGPHLGEHTRAVLAELLGLAPGEIDALAADGTIATR